MILFEQDWKKFPSAIPDMKTNNGYFLDFAGKLAHHSGIKNCYWPISLLNPELSGLDPFSPNLTIDEKFAIKMEAFNNIWYYLRECLLIPPAVGDGGNQFRANRANMSLIWSYCNHIDYLLIQPRQTGKSISADALSSWLLYIRYRNARIGLVTKSDELRSENAARLRKIKEYLPPYLVVQDRNDSLNDSLVTYKKRANRFAIAVSRADENGAYRVGRGNTTPTNFWDEAPYIANIKIAYTACMASGDAVIKEAKRKGYPYGSLITTTAGKQDDRDGSFIYDMWVKACRWSDTFYDLKDEETLREVVKSHCKGRKIIINGTWSHLQVGVSDKEHYENMAKNSAEGEDADRDYFNIWTVGGLKNPLNNTLLKRIVASKRVVEYSEIFDGNFIMQWFITKEQLDAKRATMTFVIGADTSEGGGNDSLTMVALDPIDCNVLGTSAISEVLLPRYAEFIYQILVKYPKSIYIPERKSTGQSFIDYLCIKLHSDGIDPFKRIYNVIVQDKDVNPNEFSEIQGDLSIRNDAFYIRRKTKFGFCTGTTTRKTLYGEILQIAAKRGGGKVNDEMLIAEILGLEEKGGRVDHTSGRHDDRVIAWLLTVWLLIYGNNLAYYGLDRNMILSRAMEDDELNPSQRADQNHIDDLNASLNETLEILKDIQNPMLIERYESKLRYIEGQLSECGVQSVNISSLIEELYNERAKRSYRGYR